MNNLILFTNTFLSYIVVMAVIFVVAAVACFIGIKWRKAKDAKLLVEGASDASESEKIES